MHDILKPYLESFCALLYSKLVGQYPDFLRAHWQDKVFDASIKAATGATLTDDEATTLTQEAGYVAARRIIATFYLETNAALQADESIETAIV